MPRLRFSEFLDKLILLLAMLVFLLVGVASIRSTSSLNTMTETNRPMLSENKVNVDRYEVLEQQIDSVKWSDPISQSRGEDWLFDVFTPPVIYYSPVSREFTLTPPTLVSPKVPEDPYKDFGLELVDVRPRPYRLQLVGYAGEPGSYVAYFEYMPTGEMILAKVDKILVEAGVKVLSFELRQMEVEQEGSMPVFEKVGVARLLDYESGEELFLTNMETKIFSDLEARVRSIGDGQVYLVREGSQVELDNGYYIIGDLSAEPEEAMITKISIEGDRRHSRLLTPSVPNNTLNQIDEEPRPASPFAIRP